MTPRDEMLTKTYMFVTAIAALAVCACGPSSGSKLSGTVDGRPIPDWVFQFNRNRSASQFIKINHRLPTAGEEQALVTSDSQKQICDNLDGYIMAEPREAEILRLGIVPTKADIAAAAGTVRQPSEADKAELAYVYSFQHSHSVALAAGFAAVLDKGEDPHAVYQQIIVPAVSDIPENIWLQQLYIARSSVAGRKRLERYSTITLQEMMGERGTQMARSMAPPAGKGGMADVAARNMVDRQVDQLIAAKDPTFASYLTEYNPDARQHPMIGDHFQYLDQKRYQYWRVVRSQLTVWLSDATLVDTCRIADTGVRIRKRFLWFF